MAARLLAASCLVSILALAGCAEDPYERLVRCKSLLEDARSCADSEDWETAVLRCEERNQAAVASLEERLAVRLAAALQEELNTTAAGAAADPTEAEAEIVLAATWRSRGPEGPRALQSQLAAARTRLASCANPDSIAGALARGRGCRVREVATWTDDQKFDYEVCREFVLDARHGVIAQASAGYRRGAVERREAAHEARHASH